jgi:uncharacterized protein YvpB
MVLSCAVVSIAVTQSAVAQAQAESQKELSVHSLFTDNGVLQQNQPVPIWGTAPVQANPTWSCRCNEHLITTRFSQK